jgi:hypothetical protein
VNNSFLPFLSSTDTMRLLFPLPVEELVLRLFLPLPRLPLLPDDDDLPPPPLLLEEGLLELPDLLDEAELVPADDDLLGG